MCECGYFKQITWNLKTQEWNGEIKIVVGMYVLKYAI